MSAPAGTPGVPDETVDAAPTTGPRSALAAGATLGKYRLERVLGTGGMGVVWAAHDPDLERAVALKVLRHENAAVELRRRLLREARAMARLKHPNVLTVYEVDSEGDRDFIAMELVEGQSLDAWLATRPPREAIWQATLAAGQGLAAAHRAGLVHRDFKPHNVLRSDDGRVLVTDFGLARGRGDEPAPAIALEATLPLATSGLDATVDATPSRSGSRSATSSSGFDERSEKMGDGDPAGSAGGAGGKAPRGSDVPLTQTGALVGTPAYMAPEQFLGAAPDPRTDQFAFCVTAWQLFTGERPFRGTTIEELRRAAQAGVGQVKAALPGEIRAVLARGLESDPARRWPDMNALLAALERARARPQRLRRIGFTAVALALGAVLAVKLARTAPAPVAVSSVCAGSPEDELSRAWSPSVRQGLAQQFGERTAFQYVAAEIDAFAARWLDDFRATCASPRAPRTFAKLGCLLGERDEVAVLTGLLPTVPPASIDDVEMGGVLPRPEACDGDSPVTPPTLPDDPTKRAKIGELRHKLLAIRFEPPKANIEAMPALLAEAEAIGWEPIVAAAHQGFAFATQRVPGNWEVTRDHYRSANQLARRARDYHLEADTWIGLLNGEIEAVSDPSDASEATELFEQARVAAHNAGDDPAYLARILGLEAVVAVSRGRFDEAFTKYDRARAMAVSARDWAAAMRLAIDAAMVLARRDRPGDPDAAWALLQDAERAATTSKLSEDKRRGLASALGLAAVLRGDLTAAHAWADREGSPKPIAEATAISGRVVDAAGQAVAGARVVAWRGLLDGDATRAYVRPTFEGDIATSAADGTFTVHATPASAIIAELGDRRSRPQVIGSGALALNLEPTRTVAGSVAADDDHLTGVLVIAHYRLVRGLAWRSVTAVTRTNTYQLAGLPAGDALLRLDTSLDPNRPARKLEVGPLRDGAALRWPVGPNIDAIVRRSSPRGASPATRPAGPAQAVTSRSSIVVPVVYVLRGRHSPKSYAELEQLADRSEAVMVHAALVIGVGDQTVEGIKHYARGDQHAVLVGNPPGPVTVCASEPDAATATCQTIEIPKVAPGKLDSHLAYPAIPVVLVR